MRALWLGDSYSRPSTSQLLVVWQLCNNKTIHFCKQAIRDCIIVKLLPTVKLREVDSAMRKIIDIVDILQEIVQNEQQYNP